MKILRRLNKKKVSTHIGQKDEIAACNMQEFLCDCKGVLNPKDPRQFAEIKRAQQGVSRSAYLGNTDQGCIMM